MGRFADVHIEGFSDAELDQYEHLLDAIETDLLAWVTGVVDVPRRARHGDVPPRARFPSQGRALTDGENAGQVSRRTARARPPADARQRRRRRRRPGHFRSRPRGRRAHQPAGDERAGDLPRRAADGGAGPRAVVLRARHRGAAIPGLGLPALRPGVAAWRHRRAAHDRAVAARPRQGPREARGAAHHRQRRAAARAGAGADRQAGAVGRARQRARHGGRDPLARAQRLQPRLDGARVRRLRRARRHPRPVRLRHGPAGAARFLRRHAGNASAASIRRPSAP